MRPVIIQDISYDKKDKAKTTFKHKIKKKIIKIIEKVFSKPLKHFFMPLKNQNVQLSLILKAGKMICDCELSIM